MKYFNAITDLKSAKAHYRALAKQMHPDRGGSASQFQEMRAEYALLLEDFKEEVENNEQSFSGIYDEILSEMRNLGLTPEQISLIEKTAGRFLTSIVVKNPTAKSIFDTLGKLLG